VEEAQKKLDQATVEEQDTSKNKDGKICITSKQ